MERAIFLRKDKKQINGDLVFDFCGVSQTMPFHSFGPAIRENFVLHVVLEGKGIYQVKDQQFQLEKGDLFLVRPNELTFYRADGKNPWLYAWIAFSGESAEKIIQETLLKKNAYTMKTSKMQQFVQYILNCLSFQQNDLSSELQLNAITNQFLAELLQDQGHIYFAEEKIYSPLTIEAMEYIQKNYQKDITVTEIAEALSVNRSHLSRVFSNHLTTTIKDYLTGVRINQAAFLLSFGEDSIETISEAVGFNSLVVFSRAFKKSTGETASHYRKRMKENQFQDVSLDRLKIQLEQQKIISRAT
ncbi:MULTISPECIES: AraC family transcriptional regulator [Enterococcus]|uniref:AraC family transcriptional regulator n=1 Tax=Enterococcus alishanensis TaxID=1303817 RepID=A0ABS6TDN7_9ENTE|nr:AraC family transcriptional regulator [Enterococcus alishanensis]MBV7391004.1 AraC family transcriptional regulator [Enterococcus alishanensis]